jgi:hypothetical protein
MDIRTFTTPLPSYDLIESWGHSLPVIDPSKVFRVFLQNPNGLSLKYKNFPLQNDFYISHDYRAPILSLPETNVNWNLTYQSSIFMSLLHNTWRTSAYSFSKAPKDFLSQYQPGGTATIVCNDWVSRVFDIGEDHLGLGWWSFVTLQGKGQKKITIVMAYNASLILGDTTNFHQQQWVLTTLHVAHNQRVDSQPRRQFMLDLQAWLEHIIQDNHEVILSMDANTTYDPDTRHSSHPVIFKTGVPTADKKQDGTLASLIATCGLTDPLARHHNQRPFPPSHIRGSERIDFILVTPALLPMVLVSRCMSHHSLFTSDHRPCYIDLGPIAFFSDPAYEIEPRTYRRLRLNDPKLTLQYQTELHDQLTHHDIFNKLDQLKEHAQQGTWTDQHTQQYLSLDNTIMVAMLHAENKTGRKTSTKYDWSPTL